MPCVQKSDGSFGLLYTYTALLQIGKKKNNKKTRKQSDIAKWENWWVSRQKFLFCDIYTQN